MKQVIAYIKPIMLEKVTARLQATPGVSGMSVIEARGFGRGKGKSRQDAEIDYFKKNVRIELMVPDSIVWEVVDLIRENAWSGEHGEGKIYVLSIEEAVRIRTNERGESAV